MHGIRIAQVRFPISPVVNPLKFVPKTWLPRAFSRLPPLPAPPRMVSTPCPRPAPCLAWSIGSTPQRRPRPSSPHLNARQHIPVLSAHPDQGPTHRSRAHCQPISPRSLTRNAWCPSATLWQCTTAKRKNGTPYFSSWSPPSVAGPDSAATTWKIKKNRESRTRTRRVGGEVTIHISSPAGRYVPVPTPRERAPLPRKLPLPSLPSCALRARSAAPSSNVTPGSSILRRGAGRVCPGAHGSTVGQPEPPMAPGVQPRHR